MPEALAHNAASPIICAIDTTDLVEAKRLITQVRPYVWGVKLGLEFFTAQGPEGVKQIIEDLEVPVFLDLKFHDIPNTVSGAVVAALQLGAAMMTVHTSGGRAMMEAAVKAANTSNTLLLGVTVLTSLDEDDLGNIGVQGNTKEQVLKLAKLAHESGLGGCVCSPHEIALIREKYSSDQLKLVVPGIRPEGNVEDDQKRTMVPKEALQAGADFLVIGRPITQASDPALAAKNIVDTLN